MSLSRRKFLKVLGGTLLLPGSALSQSKPSAPGNLRMSGGGKTTYVADTGNSATNAANLQAALNVSVAGETIELAPGARYQGPIYLPNRGNAGKITLRTAGYRGAGWPASGTRVTPAHVGLMATITPPEVTVGLSAYPALGWRNNADNWTIQGIQFLATSNSFAYQNSGILMIRDDTNTDVSGFPRNAVLQHCLIRGEATYGCLNGVRIMAHNVTIRDCTIDRIWNPYGSEGQGIEMLGGSNHLVENCFLEGATETIMIGGNPGYGDPAKRPQDITIRYCTFTKPTWIYSKSPDWNGTPYTMKNLFEVKGGRRILVEGCDFSNFFTQHQVYPWVISVRRGYDSWMDIEDVTFRNCRIRNTSSVLSTLSYDDLAYVPPDNIVQGRRITVENCLFYNIDNHYYAGDDGTPLFQMQFPYATIKHCTWWKAPAATVNGWSSTVIHSGDGNVMGPYPGFVFKDNVGMSGHYNVLCGPSPHGAWYFHYCSDVYDGTRDWVCTNNVLPNGTAVAIPNYNGVWPAAGNSFPDDSLFYNEFVDPANGNFRLKPGSSYRNTATDGKDPGVDMDALEAALAGIK